DPLTDGNRVAALGRAAADAALRFLAYDRVGRIGIHDERSVVGFAAHIAHGKHEVTRQPAFNRQGPLLAGGCAQDGIETAGAIDPAGWKWRCPRGAARGWKRGILLKRNARKQPVRHRWLLARTKRGVVIGPVPEVILEIVVDPKAGSHRPGSPAGRVPRDAHAGLQQ